MAKKSSPAHYQIKITLDGTKPAIWRRFVVPGDITLARLHQVIQIVMGWFESHLHDFSIGGERYMGTAPDGTFLDEMDALDERKFRLHDLVSTVKSKFRYQYDFGDSWDHTLLVEKILPPGDHPGGIACIAGAGHCPPEDCGGIPGFYYLLEILADPKNPEYAERMDWLGEAFDPDAFDQDGVNKLLGKLRGR